MMFPLPFCSKTMVQSWYLFCTAIASCTKRRPPNAAAQVKHTGPESPIGSKVVRGVSVLLYQYIFHIGLNFILIERSSRHAIKCWFRHLYTVQEGFVKCRSWVAPFSLNICKQWLTPPTSSPPHPEGRGGGVCLSFRRLLKSCDLNRLWIAG